MFAFISSKRPGPAPLLLGIAILAYIGVFAALNIARFYGLKSNIADIGVFNQIYWLMLHHGNPFATANHFFPILWAFMPFYALAPHPETLQILNVVLLASAAIPIYLTARYWQLSPWLATAWAVVYLVNPFVLGATQWDFREVAPAALIMSCALYALARRDMKWLLAMLFLLLLCKEHYGLNVAGFGLLWAILYRKWRSGLLITLTGMVAFGAIILLVLPAMNGYAPMGQGNGPQTHYAWIFHLTSVPPETLHLILLAATLYAMRLLLPFCWVLPLYAGIWLLPAMGDLAMNMLSSLGYIRSVNACHSATIIPVLVIASIRASLAISTRWPKLRLSLITLLVTAGSIAFGYVNAPVPGAQNFWEVKWSDLSNPQGQDVAKIRAMFPPEKKLALQSNIGGFFTGRPDYYTFPNYLDKSDAIILHLHYPFLRLRDALDAPFGVSEHLFLYYAERMIHNPEWGVTYWHNGWLVLERGKPDLFINRAPMDNALQEIDAAYQQAGELSAPY